MRQAILGCSTGKRGRARETSSSVTTCAGGPVFDGETETALQRKNAGESIPVDVPCQRIVAGVCRWCARDPRGWLS